MLRHELAQLITQPENRYFPRAFVNRVWKELMGRGFFEPIDNYSAYNEISHTETLEYLSDEFVASGYDVRAILRIITGTEAYRRGHHYSDTSEKDRKKAEHRFVATPVRRMISEAFYDSVLIAGNLSGGQKKWRPGENVRTITETIRIALPPDPDPEEEKKPEPEVAATPTPTPTPASTASTSQPSMSRNMAGPNRMQTRVIGGYGLEQGLEVDFDSLISGTAKVKGELANMKKMSDEKLRMQQERTMMQQTTRRRTKYTYRNQTREVDDNPSYPTSAMRMQSPAPAPTFLRVFGQPARDRLGEFRDPAASMRQALMLINGKNVHEASRVGTLEQPLYGMLTKKDPNIDKAIEYAYLSTLTRKPTEEEHLEALTIIHTAGNILDGMADLRWTLFNTHEFRFL